jgi:F0F1-type ATP synthase beta subunit
MITPIMVIALLIFKFLPRRRRMPTVVSIFEESSQRASAVLTGTHDSEVSRIQQMMNRIREIEKKIEIVRMQNISEEAKNITIRELEEEKRILEEEIKKFKT